MPKWHHKVQLKHASLIFLKLYIEVLQLLL